MTGTTSRAAAATRRPEPSDREARLALNGEIERLEALVDTDPAAALEGARRLLGGAAGEVALAAHQVAGFAARRLHAMQESSEHFEHAVALAEAAGDAATAGRLLRSLAGNLAIGGRFADALATLDRAAANATGYEAVVVEAQRATIYLASDRHADAVALFGKIIPAIEATGDETVLGQVLGNLGSALMQLQRFDEATAALRRARQLYEQQDRRIPLGGALHNLGLCAAMAGHVPEALQHFHEAKDVAAETGVVDAIGLADEARALLAARLATEAEAAARAALARLNAGEVHTWVAEAQLVLAQALLAQGRRDEAAVAAAAARVQFDQQERAPGAALAAALALSAAPALGEPPTIDEACDLAAELNRHGYAIDAADLLVTAARAALLRGDREAARKAAAAVTPPPHDRPAGLRIREAYARAVACHCDGDPVAALEAVRAGMAALEAHRLSLGATELRVRASELGVDLAELGLGVVLASGSPEDVFTWADRLRANSIEFRPGRPPPDADVRDALTAVRAAALDAAGTERLAQAERQVVEALRRSRGGAPAASPGAAPPVAGTVAFFQHGGQLHRIDVAHRVAPPQSLGPVPAVLDRLGHLTAAWRRWLRLRRSPSATLAAVEAALAAGLEEVDALLGIPGDGATTATIVPSAAVHGVPWSALPSLQERPVRVAPSAALASRPGREPRSSAVFVAGPRLEWSRAEVEELAALRSDAVVHAGEAASSEAVLASMEGADLVHFAAHGRLRRDNPLFSSLLLADGPLTVCDFEQLTDPPRVVVLSACDAGMPTVHPGDEVMGLVAALLQAGADTVIAPVLPVEDAASVPVMRELHTRLTAGERPAVALRATIGAFPIGAPEGVLARSLVCFGAG